MSIIIPGTVSGMTQSHAAVSMKQPLDVQLTEAESPIRSGAPVVDEYIPEEKQAPLGRYWLDRDEDG